MKVEEKIKSMGLNLPEPPKPVAAYVPAVVTGDGYVYTAGQIPFVNGELAYKGKIGRELDEAQGYAAAQVCVLNCLGAIKAAIGDLDRIEQVVKVVGFVASAPGFNAQPKVVNGASELLGKLFGAAGEHARSAVGVAELPLDAACEVELIVKIK